MTCAYGRGRRGCWAGGIPWAGAPAGGCCAAGIGGVTWAAAEAVTTSDATAASERPDGHMREPIGKGAPTMGSLPPSRFSMDPTPRFVTASLHVEFLRPTPLGPELLFRARPVEVGERKVIVEVSVLASETECARGRVVAVGAPSTMRRADGGATA